MNPIELFKNERTARIEEQGKNLSLIAAARHFQQESIESLYSYNFAWMGIPIIQYPQDILEMQAIIWDVKPDLVIETGIAHGGSIIFYASMLELIGKGNVIGIEVEIRPHNRQRIENHPMFKRITMIEGDSVSDEVVNRVKEIASQKKTVLVCLDSNHTYDHVLREMILYSPFVTIGSYLIVFDTIIEDLPENLYHGRAWGKDNNPKTAVEEFLKKNSRFVIDELKEKKLLITVAPGGYLKCIKEKES